MKAIKKSDGKIIDVGTTEKPFDWQTFRIETAKDMMEDDYNVAIKEY